MKRIKPKPLDVRDPQPSNYPDPIMLELSEIFHSLKNKKLPEDTIRRALINTNTYWGTEGTRPHHKICNFHDALNWGFVWSKTPEGSYFWDCVDDYVAGTRATLPTPPTSE